MLTLYLLPCDNPKLHNPERARESFGDVVRFTRTLKSRRLDLERHFPTIWYGYIFSDEYLDDQVRDALPIFLASDQFDALILMKKELIDGCEDACAVRVTQAPRIFRKHVRLEEGKHIPRDPHLLIFERLLDGWIRS